MLDDFSCPHWSELTTYWIFRAIGTPHFLPPCLSPFLPSSPLPPSVATRVRMARVCEQYPNAYFLARVREQYPTTSPFQQTAGVYGY